MSRRKIKFSSEDLGPESEARKIIKKYQSKGLQENLLNSDGKVQPQITQFFSKGKKEQKKTDREVEPMEEEKASPNEKLEEEKKTITLTISDSDSETSYYSDKQEKSEKATPVKKVVPVKKASPPPSPRRTLRDMPNVVFYKNLAASRPQGDYIEKIHRYWKGDFKKLEIHHGFVQWLFPNYYSSGYNKDSFPLKPDEAMIFRGDKEIAERLVKSYEMMLEFYGMRLVDKKTGKLQRASNYEIRYKNALMTNLHNHLRIKRILAHLSIVGFRQYAIELVNFLEVEIYGEKGGHKKYLEQKKPLSLDYLKTINKNPLFPLVRHDIFKDWSIYGETKTDTELNLLMMHAQVTDQKDFDPSILLRSK